MPIPESHLFGDSSTTLKIRLCRFKMQLTSLYTKLNDLLRAENRAILKQHFFPYLRLLVGALDSLLAAEPVAERVLFRGVKIDLVNTYPDTYSDGCSFILWPVTSCTANLSVLQNPVFLGDKGARTQFIITTQRAVNIKIFSAIPDEAEWLLPPGSAMETVSVLSVGAGLIQIQVRDDIAAPQLIQRKRVS